MFKKNFTKKNYFISFLLLKKIVILLVKFTLKFDSCIFLCEKGFL